MTYFFVIVLTKQSKGRKLLFFARQNIIRCDKKFLFIFKNSNVTACDPIHPLKVKYLIFCNK